MKNKLLIIFFLIIFNIFAEESNIKELFKISSLWQVGDNKVKVQKARDQLVQMGEKSLNWIYENEFKKDVTALDLRAIEYIFKQNSKTVEFIFNKIKTEKDKDKLSLLIYLMGKLKDDSFKPFLRRIQTDEKLRYGAIIALANYGELYSKKLYIKTYKKSNLPKKIRLIAILSRIKNTNLTDFLHKIKIQAQKKNEPLIYYACVKVEKDLK